MKVKQKRESKQSSGFHSSKIKSNISPLLAYYSSKQSISHYSEMNYSKAIHHTLLNRYSIKSKDYISFQIEQLLDNKKTHLVALFKDNMISNSKEEYLKREYNRKESIERIPKFVKYYKNYLVFFCKPTFSNFRFNNIIQLSSRRSAQVYYGIYYAKNNKKDKKEAKVDYMKVFSLSVREAINNNQTNMIKYNKRDRIICSKDNDKKIDESTIQLTFIEENTLKEGGKPLKENDSMISLVNLINNNNFNQKANCSKRNIENNLKINSKNNNVNTVNSKLDKKELLKQSIEDKPTNQVKYKLKINQQPKDNKCNQLVTEINKKYLKTESSSKIDQPKINNNIYQNTEPHHPNRCLNFNSKGQLKTKIKHVRKALSTLPNANTTEGNKTNMKMYSTPYPTINTSQNANAGIKYLSPSAFSPKIQTKNNLTSSSNNKEGVYGKTISHFHHKEISMMTKNEYNTKKTKAKEIHRTRPLNIFPFTNAVYSSFNNYDKQQQILNSNNNMQTISKETNIISISKEIRHKNNRFNSETLKSVNDCSIRRNNTKSFKYNNNTISNTNTDANAITYNNNNNKASITNEPLKDFLRIRKQKKSHK